jgi:hypothetical protein
MNAVSVRSIFFTAFSGVRVGISIESQALALP